MSDSPNSNGQETGQPERADYATRFKPGQVANPAGRPRGSRDKLDRAFVKALLKDFREHGMTAITKTRDEKPDAYLNVIAKVLPKEVRGEVTVKQHEQALDQLE